MSTHTHRLARLAHAALCCVLGQQLALPSAAEAPPLPLPPPRSFHVPAAARAAPAPVDAAAVLRSALLGAAPAAAAAAAAAADVCTDPDELERYSSSQYSYHTGARPAAIVFPRSTAQVAALVRACAEHRLALVPRSGGTSLEGHVLPVPQALGPGAGAAAAASVVLDFSRMARVLRVSSADMDVTVQAGVGWLELAEALRPHGLMFPVDPGPGAQVRKEPPTPCLCLSARAPWRCGAIFLQRALPTTTLSLPRSPQIGGMCGTCCSGTHAVRYGAMKANVLSLTAVASDGAVFRTGARARKSVAGLDLTSLLIGSEGTLAVVTEAVLRVVPRPAVEVVVATPFPSARAACQAVADAARSGVPLAAAELMDARMCGVVHAQSGGALLPAGAVPHVLWKLAGAPGAVEEAAASLRALAQAAGATGWQRSGAAAEEAAALWEARKAALFSVQAAHPGCSVLTTDVCVPVSLLPALLEAFAARCAAAAAQGRALPAAFAVAHAGDGNAHHFLAFQPGSAAEATAKELADWLAREAIRLEGTCTGEHGVGSGKRKYLLGELGAENARVAAAIKGALDPHGTLNPGKKLVWPALLPPPPCSPAT